MIIVIFLTVRQKMRGGTGEAIEDGMVKKEKLYRKKAVALQYIPGRDPAPTVTAKGRGRVAERLIEAAKTHGIPVKSDPDLVAVLSELDIEAQIPSSVYIVVAELLAFVYALNRQKEPS